MSGCMWRECKQDECACDFEPNFTDGWNEALEAAAIFMEAQNISASDWYASQLRGMKK